MNLWTLFLTLCISYDCILKISTELGNNICYYYEQEKVICPPPLKGGIFTTAAVDNIDHNPSSTDGHDSFHGTKISLFQHLTEKNNDENGGVQLPTDAIQDNIRAQKKALMLPEFYTTVPHVAVGTTHLSHSFRGPTKESVSTFLKKQ